MPWNTVALLQEGQILETDSQAQHTSPSTKAIPSQPVVRHLNKTILKHAYTARFWEKLIFQEVFTGCFVMSQHADRHQSFASLLPFEKRSVRRWKSISMTKMKHRIAQPSMTTAFQRPLGVIRGHARRQPESKVGWPNFHAFCHLRIQTIDLKQFYLVNITAIFHRFWCTRLCGGDFVR